MSTRTQAERKWTERSTPLFCPSGQTEGLFLANEAQLRALVENAPEAIVVFDGATGRFVTFNANATRLYGLTRDELLHRTPAEVSPEYQPDGRRSADAARERIQAALAGATPVFEWIHRHASGRLVPCEVRLLRLPCEGPPLVRASILDNTERYRREKIQQATYHISEAVHAVEDLDSLYARIHTIIMSLMPARNFYIALLDPHSELIWFPYYVDQRSPKPNPRKLTTGLTGFVLRTGRPLLVDAAMNARKRQVGDAVTFEGFPELTYVESGIPAAIWLGVPLLHQGSILGVMAVQDYEDGQAYGEAEKQILMFVAVQTALAITRKRAQQDLRESEQKFRALFEASSQGVMLLDEQQLLEVNPAAVRMLGFHHAQEIVGKHPADASPPFQPNGRSSAEMAQEFIQTSMSEGSARFEWLTLTPGGEQIPLEVILTRIPMRGRQIIQAVINDIRERKKAEAELLKALDRERELSALKGRFVSLVSHEFRTPLGIIMSSAEILQDYFTRLKPEERRQHLDSIQQNTRRMGELMEEVLLLSRFDAGKMQPKPEPMDLGELFTRLRDEILASSNHHCPIALEIEPWPGTAVGDERLLRHIFTNLLANAVKYSPAGASVLWQVARAENDLVCRIADRGLGIPAADQEWLFEPFHRGRNVGDRPGTGLGLVVVKRCVDAQGGRIQITSTEGAGTEVTVRLPLFAPGAPLNPNPLPS